MIVLEICAVALVVIMAMIYREVRVLGEFHRITSKLQGLHRFK